MVLRNELVGDTEYESCSAEGAFHESLGRCPISVNLSNLRLYVEDLSRRDSVKVAQYEVLGNDAKRHVRPGRDDRKRPAFGLARRSAIANFRSIVRFLLRRPDYGGQAGTDTSLRTLTQHFVLGYFRQVPAGLIFSPPTAILIATS